MFYTDVSQAVQRAVADPTCPRRMKLLVAPPELNMEMDSYRVGSLLELVREIALGLAEQGLRMHNDGSNLRLAASATALSVTSCLCHC